MSRLPVVGGDANTWGTVLNDYLTKLAIVASFSRTGTLSVVSGVGRYLFPVDVTITGVIAAVNTAPVGTSIIVDVNKNGTTIFTTQGNRPAILGGNFKTAAIAVPDISTALADDYLSVDIDQVGSSTPGADLVVQVTYVPR